MKTHPRKTATIKHEMGDISPGLPCADISRLQNSFQVLAPRAEEMAFRFYDQLLRKFPELRSFFDQTRLSEQRLKFVQGLRTLIHHLENPHELRTILLGLGSRHQQYGVEIQHYPPVLDTLLGVLKEAGEERIDGKTYDAWENFLHLIRAIMLENHFQRLGGEDSKDDFYTALSGNFKRILLIDDDRQLLDLYHSYLEIQGHVCSQVFDVAWAFTHLQMSRYDLVLTDFQMPVINGIQLKKALDRLDRDMLPPFVLITGNLTPEIRRQAFEAGFTAAMKKPHDLNEFHSVLRKASPKSMLGSLNKTGCIGISF